MQYSIGTKINSGRFGNVYRVKKDGKTYAAKLLPKHKIDTPHSVNIGMIQREINNHKKVNGHRNIVELFDIVEDWGNFYIIEEYCKRGDLNAFINKYKIEEVHAQIILRDCLHGLVECHKAGFIFGDLKPANVLVADTMHFKLCDFGGTEGATGLYTGSTHIRGTPAFLAPESYIFKEEHGFISDMWSLGVLAYILLYDKYPFDIEKVCSMDEFKDKILNTNIAYEHETLTVAARDFVQLCLQKDVMERITPENALSHPFLCNV